MVDISEFLLKIADRRIFIFLIFHMLTPGLYFAGKPVGDWFNVMVRWCKLPPEETKTGGLESF